MSAPMFVEFKDVCKYYQMAIRNCGFGPYLFSDWAGRILCHCWPSGAGKTTVLNMLGGMDSCDSGKMLVDGVDISTLSEKELTDYRRYDVGFVFQFYNLVQNLTALEMWSWLPRFVRIRWILKGRLRRWDYRSACIIFQRSYPAVSSSGFLLPEPLRKTLKFFYVTSQPARWIITPVKQF